MIDPDGVPAELRTTDRALLWRHEERDGKATKVPYVAGRPSEHAAVNDPSTWGDFETALANVQDGKADGVGVVLGSGIVGVDLDDCRDPETGELEGWAREIVDGLNSYTEISPSGTGLHVLARGSLPEGRRRKGSIEIYADGRYFTLTGARLEGTPRDLRERTAELAALHARIFGENGRREPQIRQPSSPVDVSDRRLLERAREAENGAKFSALWAGNTSGYDSHSEADLALVNLLAFWTRGDVERMDRLFRRSGLMRQKWEREDYRKRTISAALEGRTEFFEPGPAGRAPARRGEGGDDEEEPEFGERDLTHDGLALDLGDAWEGEAQHVAAWGSWYFWDSSVWRRDETLEHMTRARQFLRALADRLDDDAEKAKKKLRSAHTVARVVSLARSNEAQAADVDQWDANPWLLGTPDGTVDLRTGEIREPRAEDYITKSTAVAPAPEGATGETWTAFLEDITAGNEGLQVYLQRFAGYSLTGLIKEHAFAFAHGTGANGKSVFSGALKGVMGDYALTVPTEMLMVSRESRHPTELARLRGVRLAVGSEMEQGKRWAEAKIKALTGGDPIAARFMRQDYFEFDPQFKLLIVGNHRPSLRGVDEAMRRRLHLVPFTVTIPAEERDLDLPKKLEAEWPEILRWAIDGCRQWQREGLNPPSCVQEATEEYLDAEDAFSLWIEECATEDPNAFESSKALYNSWRRWAEQAGEFVGSKKRLSRELQKRGYEQKRHGSAGTRGYVGLRLDPVEDERWSP